MLVRVLDVIRDDEADLPRLAEAVRQDAALASRLIAVANSSQSTRAPPCQTVDRALLVLGVDTVKTIVITTATRQFFSDLDHDHQVFLKAFWRRSLTSAHFAHALANLTGYPAADQAYLAGLLTDLGQLALLSQHGQAYLRCWQAATDRQLSAAERERFGEAHGEVGARLAGCWQIDPLMADAIRYHHEDAPLVLDAHHLVKVINLSSLLSAPDSDAEQAAAQAGMLFGLREDRTLELRQRVEDDVERLARVLDIDTGDPQQARDAEQANQQLGRRLGELGELSRMSAELRQAQTRHAFERAVHRVVYMMLGVERCLLFTADPAGQQLQATAPAATSPGHAGFRLPLLPERSVVSDALLQNRLIDSDERSVLPVIDLQLQQYCHSERLVCMPLVNAERPAGVLVLGMNGTMPLPSALLGALCREVAAALDGRGPSTAGAATPFTENELRQRIQEAIHEAGNPLSIIGNYLEMLRLRLGDEHQANDDIDLIRQEIDRIGNILTRLREPQEEDAGGELDLNRLIEQLARILERSVFTAHGLRLELRLDRQAPVAAAAAAPIKQIVINLAKNAAEALQAGGAVTIATAANINVDGNRYTGIMVEDNGPGIPPAVMEQLFSAVISGKDGGRSGLGLSITKRLIEELGGTIMCRSGAWGTQFQVLIPQGEQNHGREAADQAALMI